MKKMKMGAIVLIALLCLTVFVGCATTGASTNKVFSDDNAYEFKLVEPTSHDISLNAKNKAESKVQIKIAFNEEKVNAKGAYYALFVDGLLGRTRFSTNLESPIEASINARNFANGKHTVEYVLLPAGSMEKKDALAGVRINLNISGSISKKDLELADALVAKVIDSIKKNDEKAFADLFINKAKVQTIAKGVSGSAKEVAIAKEVLQELSSDRFAEKSGKDFKKLQKHIKTNAINKDSITFKSYGKAKLQIDTSAFKGVECLLIYESKKFRLFSDCAVVITKDKAYLVDYKPYDMVMPK